MYICKNVYKCVYIFIILLKVQLTLLFKIKAIQHIKFFKGIDCGFDGFDTTFSKNLIDLFPFSP